MSQVIVVNEKDEIIGTMSREEAHNTGTSHRIVVVYVENTSGEILVQIRMSGHLDHSSAGHVDPGESYLNAAKRELKEELGVENVNLISIGKGISRENNGHDGGNRVHVFEIFKCLAEPGNLQPDEVKQVYWAKPEEILKEMKEDKTNKFAGGFIDSLPIYLANKNS